MGGVRLGGLWLVGWSRTGLGRTGLVRTGLEAGGMGMRMGMGICEFSALLARCLVEFVDGQVGLDWFGLVCGEAG